MLQNDERRVKLSREKFSCGFPAHIAFQQGLRRAAQVGHHQYVQDARKMRVDVESKYTAASLHILLDQKYLFTGLTDVERSLLKISLNK